MWLSYCSPGVHHHPQKSGETIAQGELRGKTVKMVAKYVEWHFLHANQLPSTGNSIFSALIDPSTAR
jgi:hypothetical protein